MHWDADWELTWFLLGDVQSWGGSQPFVIVTHPDVARYGPISALAVHKCVCMRTGMCVCARTHMYPCHWCMKAFKDVGPPVPPSRSLSLSLSLALSLSLKIYQSL
jgi:hypothetical protein